MIDWFVLLIPLVLLPVFALLVFVGCHLLGDTDELHIVEDGPRPIYLHYAADLDSGSDLESDVASFQLQFKFGGATIGTVQRFNDGASGFPDPETAIPTAMINLSEVGQIICEGYVQRKSGLTDYPELPKHKHEYLDPPSFRLERIPNPPPGETEKFHIV